MARELSGPRQLTRVAIKSDDSNDPDACNVEYSVVVADGIYDDIFEPAKVYNEASPDFNQTVTAFCSATATTVKTAESI